MLDILVPEALTQSGTSIFSHSLAPYLNASLAAATNGVNATQRRHTARSCGHEVAQ